MPINNHRSNNRILPANTRTVDVAKQALSDLIPVEQRRYHNAFLVNGFECLVYNNLNQGQVCSCQAHGKTLATLLDEDGKMPVTKQNELLTGLSFKVNLYGASPAPRDDMRETLGKAPPLRPNSVNETPKDANTIQPPFEVKTRDASYPFASVVTDDGADNLEDDFGSNGPNNSLDDRFNDFDSGSLGSLGDTTCAICFGHGYVGGFSLLGGWRQVFTSQWENKRVDDAFIEVNRLPHFFHGTSVTFIANLPRGFRHLDRMSVWNNTIPAEGATIKIDGQVATYPVLFSKFDGGEHEIEVSFVEPTDWTHLEFQVDLGNEARLEFPRMTRGFDASKLDGVEDIQINMSPLVPYVTIRDVVVESTFGKAFVLTSAQLWNDSQRKTLGWDCQARIVQPNEILNLLPRRRSIQQNRPTNLIRDNVDGRRRT